MEPYLPITSKCARICLSGATVLLWVSIVSLVQFICFHLCINLMSFVLTKKLFIIIIIITKASMYKMSPKDKLGAQAVTVSLCLCLVLVHGLILRILAKLYECLNCEPLKVYTYWSKPHYCCIFVCKAL